MGRTQEPIRYRVDGNGCHVCTSHYINADGYPQISSWINGVKVCTTVVRFLYRQHTGMLPDGEVLRHICDNPRCIRIDHLVVGTHADNVLDRVDRDRSAKGERHGRAKLTEDIVRSLRSITNPNISSLSKQLGVDRRTIRDAILGKTWRHV